MLLRSPLTRDIRRQSLTATYVTKTRWKDKTVRELLEGLFLIGVQWKKRNESALSESETWWSGLKASSAVRHWDRTTLQNYLLHITSHKISVDVYHSIYSSITTHMSCYNTVFLYLCTYIHTGHAWNNDHPSTWFSEKGKECIRYCNRTESVHIKHSLDSLYTHPLHVTNCCNASIVHNSPQR